MKEAVYNDYTVVLGISFFDSFDIKWKSLILKSLSPKVENVSLTLGIPKSEQIKLQLAVRHH